MRSFLWATSALLDDRKASNSPTLKFPHPDTRTPSHASSKLPPLGVVPLLPQFRRLPFEFLSFFDRRLLEFVKSEQDIKELDNGLRIADDNRN